MFQVKFFTIRNNQNTRNSIKNIIPTLSKMSLKILNFKTTLFPTLQEKLMWILRILREIFEREGMRASSTPLFGRKHTFFGDEMHERYGHL
jgi:hypothetical protein